jgi:hypothetical protein
MLHVKGDVLKKGGLGISYKYCLFREKKKK